MRLLFALLVLTCVCALAPTARAASPESERAAGGRVRVVYWEKWVDFERAAMQAVVDAFNRSQDRIYVEYVSVSSIGQKTLIATAGGNPPDLAGVAANDVVDFAARDALTPLDDFARGTLVHAERYLPLYWDMGVYRGVLYGVPSVPVVTGLHWNKRLFREAGLDPERPPRTIAELDAFAERLTVVENGNIRRVGFLPATPSYFPFFWGAFFGAELWDGDARILLDSPENRQAYTWVQSYAKRFGVPVLQRLASSFGNLASAEDPFMAGRLAMVFQGIWLANYIEQFAPELEWGAAPFPSAREGDPPVAYVDSDMLVIPRGARHPREAFEFIAFLAQQEMTERLALGQRKNSPLREVSDTFFREHRHPYIRMFQELAQSPGARAQPKMSVWKEYREEARTMFQRIWLLQATPEAALAEAQERMQNAWDRERRRLSAAPSRALTLAPIALVVLLVLGVVAAAAVQHRRARALTGGRRPARANASLWRGLGFLSPWAIGLLVFTAYPVMASLVYSFCEYSVLSVPRFIGLGNYAELLADDVFWKALGNTLIYVSVSLPLGLLSAFVVAVLLDAAARGASLYRTLVFLPALTPMVASAMAWLWIFNAEYGVLNHILGAVSFGLIGPIPWLVDPRTALPSIILMSVWSVGHAVVVLLAAMQDVPRVLYEAADIDGASLWHKLRHITLPMISPVIYFNAIIGVIGALQVFVQPFVMTGGGPARATLTYTMRLYDSAFRFLRMGEASAMAWILFLIILGLTLVLVRIGRNRVHYTGA
ncbi:MAG: extracellular solute-binding protein [Pseudomonadota bacterium]